MPFELGNKHGKGREKGSKNKVSAAVRELIEEAYPDWNPVLAMADMAQDESLENSVRVQCMKEVAGYMYPKKKAITVQNDSPGTLRLTWGKPHPSMESEPSS